MRLINNPVFERYAEYYDILYQEKDYEAECDFVEQIFPKFAGKPVETILDLGCGSGGHALPLAQRGYTVTGVDRAEAMLSLARRKAEARQKVGASSQVVFHQGDIRTLNLGQTFDVVIAMFAVISYQTTNEDLTAAFYTARRHLKPGGLFVFDAWFGPAVLTQKPQDRYKIVTQSDGRVIRFASPVLNILQHTVQVNYKVLYLKGDQVQEEVNESHLMRFLFPQEVKHYLEERSFRVVRMCPFMALGRELTEQDWNVAVVAEAV